MNHEKLLHKLYYEDFNFIGVEAEATFGCVIGDDIEESFVSFKNLHNFTVQYVMGIKHMGAP